MDKPAELLMFDFLTEKVAAAPAGTTLDGLELHDTIHQTITKTRGVRISDAVGDTAPDVGGKVKEWNVSLELSCFTRVEGKNQKERAAALQAVFDIEMAIAQLLLDDPSLGGRTCGVAVEQTPRGYVEFDGKAYAVALIPIVVNPIS